MTRATKPHLVVQLDDQVVDRVKLEKMMRTNLAVVVRGIADAVRKAARLQTCQRVTQFNPWGVRYGS